VIARALHLPITAIQRKLSGFAYRVRLVLNGVGLYLAVAFTRAKPGCNLKARTGCLGECESELMQRLAAIARGKCAKPHVLSAQCRLRLSFGAICRGKLEHVHKPYEKRATSGGRRIGDDKNTDC
jgi:hypothetical protein